MLTALSFGMVIVGTLTCAALVIGVLVVCDIVKAQRRRRRWNEVQRRYVARGISAGARRQPYEEHLRPDNEARREAPSGASETEGGNGKQ